jgi:hypothetical protein
MAIIKTRAAFWTAAALRRIFDASPKIESHQTPAFLFVSPSCSSGKSG